MDPFFLDLMACATVTFIVYSLNRSNNISFDYELIP